MLGAYDFIQREYGEALEIFVSEGILAKRTYQEATDDGRDIYYVGKYLKAIEPHAEWVRAGSFWLLQVNPYHNDVLIWVSDTNHYANFSKTFSGTSFSLVYKEDIIKHLDVLVKYLHEALQRHRGASNA